MKNKFKNTTRYQVIKCEYLKKLRKNVKQKDFSHRLGFKFNKYGKWESGHKNFKWSEFQTLCHKNGQNIAVILKNLGLISHGQVLTSKVIFKNLVLRAGLKNEIDIAKVIGHSKPTIKRWLTGEAEPNFEVIIKLIDLAPGQLAYFIFKLLGDTALPILKSEIDYFTKLDEILTCHHELILILGAIQLEKNKIKSDLLIESIAASCGLDLSTCKKYLKKGIDLGLLQYKNDIYCSPIRTESLLLFASEPQTYKALFQLTRLADSRTHVETGHFKNTTGHPNYFYTKLTVLSQDQTQKIFEIASEALGKIEKICESNAKGHLNKTDLRLIHFNFFDVRDK